jgi:hypothetical protein
VKPAKTSRSRGFFAFMLGATSSYAFDCIYAHWLYPRVPWYLVGIYAGPALIPTAALLILAFGSLFWRGE